MLCQYSVWQSNFLRASRGLDLVMPSETSTACADQSVEELRRELAAAMPKKTNVLRGGAAPMYDSHATRPICARCAEANARPNSRPRRFIALPHGILTEHELSYPTMFTRAIVGIPGFRPARGINHCRCGGRCQYCLPRWASVPARISDRISPRCLRWT